MLWHFTSQCLQRTLKLTPLLWFVSTYYRKTKKDLSILSPSPLQNIMMLILLIMILIYPLQKIMMLIDIEQMNARFIKQTAFLIDQRYQEKRIKKWNSLLRFFTFSPSCRNRFRPDREGSRGKKFSSTRSRNIVPRMYTVTLSRLLSSSPLTLRNPANLFNTRDGSSFLDLGNPGKSVFCPPSVSLPFLFPALPKVERTGKRSLVKITN